MTTSGNSPLRPSVPASSLNLPAGMTGCRAAAVIFIALTIAAAAVLSIAAPGLVAAQDPPPSSPRYRLRVTLDAAAGVIDGTLTVTLPPGDSRSGGELWFHLGPNRFLEPDPRGPRRRLGYEPFGFSFVRPDLRDPLLPKGFSRGEIEIHAVTGPGGQPLDFDFEDNPRIPKGFHTGRGLLRVRLTSGGSQGPVQLRFTTRLPRRYWEGWSRAGVFAEQWFPTLLNHERGNWLREVFRPRPGLFTLEVRVQQAGWIAAGAGAPSEVNPGDVYRTGADGLPLRSLPMAFFQSSGPARGREGGAVVNVFYPEDLARTGRLALLTALDSLTFLSDRFGLSYPYPNVTLIPVEGLLGDIRTVGTLVLIPAVFFRNSALLDRVFIARLAAAMARIWFGETVWADMDRQAWLPVGLSGYISLEYFSALYGEDGGTHNLGDWLRPRYREHYFERPVRGLIRDGDDVPVMISLTEHPKARSARISIYEKSPLLLRSLSFVIGAQRFREGLRRFVERYRFREADLGGFQREMEAVYGQSLQRFFDQFFVRTDPIDVALAGWEEEPTAEGYRVTVRVERNTDAVIPVLVEVRDQSGDRYAQRWPGEQREGTLRFMLQAPVEGITLDPDEFLLETERKDNYSERLYKLRPFFDWPKQRESLIALRGWAGGNAVDGNFLGIGVQYSFDEDNSMLIVPAYGQKSETLLYDLAWNRGHFFHPRLSLQIQRRKVGGTEFQGVGFSYRHRTPDSVQLITGVQFRMEWVQGELESSDNGDSSADRVTGNNVNNIRWVERAVLWRESRFPVGLDLELERSEKSFNSDFDYSTLRLSVGQEFSLGGDHLIIIQAVRGFTDGVAPLEKQFLLGDPALLRGYPRDVALIHEQINVARLDYQYVVSRKIIGRLLQTRRWSLILFGDVGKGWDNGVNPDQVPQRQDVGFGIIVDFNVLGQVEFPIRAEVAYPINDPEYRRRRFVLFGTLAFF